MAIGTENWVCPLCGTRVDISALGLYAEVQCPACMHTERVHAQLGNFLLEGVLGVGGMSVVYRAMDVVLNRPLAIKVLNDTFRDQPERIERFENESAMMARVRHENVTSVYSAGRAFGQFYIAMELVEGTNLEHMVTAQQPLEARYALSIIRSVAQGLEAAHKAGLLHRDMKPGNILITPEGEAKVIDFGLAVDSQEGDTEEIIWATPYYVPPETLQRKPEDVRTDIYALGMTLRYLLTGVESFEGPTDSLSALIACKRKLPSFAKQSPRTPSVLCDLVNHMTAYSAADRPEDYKELIEEIDEVNMELEKLALLNADLEAKRRARLHMTLWAITISFALGILLAVYIHPSKIITHQKSVELEAGAPPNECTQLDKAMESLAKNSPRECADTLLQLARQTTEPCMGAWSALLAKLVYYASAAPVPDQLAEAQLLFRRHINNQDEVISPGVKFFEHMKSVDSLSLPTATEWKTGTGEWKGLTKAELTSKMEQNARSAAPPVLKIANWYILAEQAAWLDDAEARAECVKMMKEESETLTVYRPVAEQLIAAASAPRSAPPFSPLAAAEYLMRSHKFDEAQQSLAAAAQDSKLSESDRARCKVYAEVCMVAKEMVAMLNRRYPGKYKPGMSADDMAALIPAPQPTVSTTDSDGTEYDNHLPKFALDGDSATTWCAPNSNPGHYLGITLDAPTPIDFVEVLWELSEPQKIDLLIVSSDGTIRNQINRNKGASIIPLDGKPLRSLKFTFNNTKQSAWASIREVRFFHKDDFLKRELTIIGLLLEGKHDAAWSKVRELLQHQKDRPKPYFNIIAENWMKLWTGETSAANPPKQAKPEPAPAPKATVLTPPELMKTYREHSTDPAKIIELCKNCVHVVVKPDKAVRFKMNPDTRRTPGALKNGQGMMCPLAEAKELEERGIVSISPVKVVPVLGIRLLRYHDYTINPGFIQPCMLDEAKYFEREGAGKILDSAKDLEGLRDKLAADPFPSQLKRQVAL